MEQQFGFDINNMGASNGSRGAINIPSPYFDAIIEDIIINEKSGEVLKYKEDGSNLGQALIRIIPTDWGVPKTELKAAYPVEMNIQEFPLVGEQVMVFKSYNELYYTRPLASRRKITENRSNIVPLTFGENIITNQERKDSRQLSTGGVNKDVTKTIFNKRNQNFSVNYNTRPLRASAGDVIVAGRFGNFIRMGSSLFSNPTTDLPEPNILLTAGAWDRPAQLSTNTITPYSLTYENINQDKSCIWMVSNEKIPFIASTALSESENKAHILSSEDRTISYTGAQIFINSDRVILNSKKNEISLFSSREINLSSIKSITLDTESSVYIRAFRNINIKADNNITFEAKQISLASLEDLAYRTTGNYTIIGKKIFIGKNGDITEPMVLGGQLAGWLLKFLQVLATGGIITTTGPATLNPALIAPLLAGLGPIPQLAVFNSRSNFTAETNSV